MKIKILFRLVAFSFGFSLLAAERPDVLERFYAENEGRTIRRLPSWIVPENVFAGFNTNDAGRAVHLRKLRLIREKSDWNVLTCTCRFADHTEADVLDHLKDAVAALRWSGVELLMDLEPRLWRDAFLKEYPGDYLRLRQFATFKPGADGKVRFEVKEDVFSDYANTGGRGVVFSQWRPGRLVAVRAAKGTSLRTLAATDVVSTKESVTGTVAGLKPGETLLVEVEWPLYEADPSSPNVMRFAREIAKGFRSLGVSGVMRDEYGFQKPNTLIFMAHLSYWYSPYFKELYSKRSGGRDLDEDLPALALGWDTPENHRAAMDYTMSIYDACKASEVELYNINKEYFGTDAYVAKHVTWHPPFDWDELWHNGLVWWAAKRDWAQTDECHPVPVTTSMMKKFGTPLWMDEGYGPNPEHYVKRLWRYAAAGGRIVYHQIFSWDPKASSVAKYTDPDERSFRRMADLLSPEGMRAERILRLLPLTTRAPIDCPVLQIFGHERLTDWLDQGDFRNWGEKLAYGLGHKGYYVDVFPASEIPDGTVTVDADGVLRVGKQRYRACVLWHLSDRELAQWEKLIGGRELATKVFVEPEVAEVEAYLESVGAVRQIPLEKDEERLPKADGIFRLTDGTFVRIKGGEGNLAGGPISGEFDFGGVKVAYSARGLFAARVENGKLVAFCGGEVTRVKGGGISLELEKPADISMVKVGERWPGGRVSSRAEKGTGGRVSSRAEKDDEGGKWCGVYQTDDGDSPVPAELMTLTQRWVELTGKTKKD